MIHYTFTLSYGDARATVRLAESATLDELADALLNAIGFELDHAFGFHSDLNSPYAKTMEREYTLFADQGERRLPSDTGVEKTTIREVFKEGDTMLFHFDYGDDWQFPVQCTAIEQSKSRKRKPETLKVVGRFPEQYPDFDEGDFDDKPRVGINPMTGERIEIKKAEKAPIQVPDYLQALEMFSPAFPKTALKEALSRKEESVPLLLELLKSIPYRVRNRTIPESYMLHEYGMHLLAELCETAAYRPLVEIAQMPELDDLIGDGVTEDLPKILAAVWDGDNEPLFKLIADNQADEFARAAGMHALGILHHTERLDREAFFAATLHIYQNCLERHYGYFWDAWVMLVADFRLSEFGDQIVEAYRSGFADPGFQSEHSALKTLRTKEPDTERLERSYAAYTSVEQEISRWVCFSRREVPQDRLEARPKRGANHEQLISDTYEEDRIDNWPTRLFASETFVREQPKIGRNDLCLCGSGKKYKKCCLS